MRVRNAALKDRKNISELYFEFNPEEKSRKAIPLERKKFKNILLIAEKDKQVVGFVSGTVVAYGLVSYGYVDELFVKPGYRGKGVGKALMKAVLKKFKKLKVKSVIVAAGPENRKAAALYKKVGFKLCKDWWFYWRPPQPPAKR